MAEICGKYEHDGDELTKDIENDIDPLDFENLDKTMIVSTKYYSERSPIFSQYLCTGT